MTPVWALAVAIVGGIVGALLTIFVQTYLAVKQADLKRIDDQIADLTAIEKLILDYWLVPGQKDSVEEVIAALTDRALAVLDGADLRPDAVRASNRTAPDSAAKTPQVLPGGRTSPASARMATASRWASRIRAVVRSSAAEAARNCQRRNVSPDPGSGTVAEPGFVSVIPGSGLIRM